MLAGITSGALAFSPLRQHIQPSVAAAATCASPNFSVAGSFNVSGARAFTIADVNRDTVPDLLVANNRGLGQVAVLLGNGNNGFSAATNFSVGTNPVSVVTGDFDNDGNLDFATANGVAASCCPDITILFGDGNGNFARNKSIWLSPGITTNPTSIAVGDFNLDGKLDLAETNSNFNSVSILLGNGLGDFTNIKSYAAGSSPAHLIVKDFNGDNKPDLAVANSASGSVSILMGDGSGAFGAASNFPVGTNPRSIVAGDFNGDGKVDLASANNTSQNISVLLGTGTGSFGAASHFATGGASPNSVASGDFNGDGNTDLAVTSSQFNNVVVLLGSGTGSFTAAANFLTGGSGPQFVVASDFNKDGLDDLAVANEVSRKISLLFNNCNSAPAAATVQFSAAGYVVFDEASGLGENGKTAIAVIRTGSLSNAGTIDYATSDGTATASLDYISTTGTLNFAEGETFKTFSVSIVDDNISEGDETVNLTLSNPGNGISLGNPGTAFLSILANDGKPGISINDISVTEGQTGTTNAVFTVSMSNPSSSIVTVDYSTSDLTTTAGEDYTGSGGTLIFNPGEINKTITASVKGDLQPEINEAFYVNLGNPTNATILDAVGTATVIDDDSSCAAPSFGEPTDFSAGLNPGPVVVGDFNNDNNLDMAVGNINGNSISIRLGNGLGGFGAASSITIGHPDSIVIGDFNSDGKVDLASTNGDGFSGKAALLLGDGAGSFAAPTNFAAGALPKALASGDFNKDGKPDLAVANLSSNNVSILLGNGTGGFAPSVNYLAGIGPNYIAAGDFNGDGKQDLAISNLNSHNVSVLAGNGAGGFAPAVNFAVNGNALSVATSDFNGDGKLDLAVATNTPDNIAVLMGDGTGNFAAAVFFTAGNRPNQIIVADFNNDGRDDLATANYGDDLTDGFVSVLFGNGKGSFSVASNFPVRKNPYAVAAGDFDKNGRLDLVVTNLRSDNVSVLFNTCQPVTSSSAPMLLTEENSASAIAFDSVTMLRDPFPLLAEYNFSSDKRTRIILFATNINLLPDESASAVTARLEDAQGNIYPLAVESVNKVPTLDWLTQVIVKLPEQMANTVDVRVSISLHGTASQKALLKIKP